MKNDVIVVSMRNKYTPFKITNYNRFRKQLNGSCLLHITHIFHYKYKLFVMVKRIKRYHESVLNINNTFSWNNPFLSTYKKYCGKFQ